MEEVKFLYETTELTIAQIAKTCNIPFYQVYKYIRNNYSLKYRDNRKSICYRNSKLGEKNPMLGNFLEQHPRYLGEISDNKGYLMKVKPHWYTGRKKSIHVFVHHIVVCEALGLTEIPKGYCVHHKDHNPLNNLIDNLELMTLSEHTKLHQQERNAPS